METTKQILPIKKISRNYFRLSVGAGLVGAPLGWLFNSVEIYGIFRQFILAYAPWISMGLFASVGCLLIFLFTFFVGFVWERLGLVKEQTAFLNDEANPQWNAFLERYRADAEFIKEKLEGIKK